MITSYLIVDEFLANPDEVRALALKMEYPQPEKASYFPGRNSLQRLNIAGLTEQVSHIVNEPVVPKAGTGHGKVRRAYKGDMGEAGVHIDGCHWSGLLCLSKNEDVVGGTDFFRHKETGFERVPIYPHEVQPYGLTEPTSVWDQHFAQYTNDQGAWDRIMTIPMRYNRLILFRSWLFHNAGPGFGSSLENCRLVLLFFFEVARRLP